MVAVLDVVSLDILQETARKRAEKGKASHSVRDPVACRPQILPQPPAALIKAQLETIAVHVPPMHHKLIGTTLQ